MSTDALTTQITAFIRDALCDDDPTIEVTETTPLFEVGILTSLKTAMLLNYIQSEFDVKIPPLRIEFRSFQDPKSIAALVAELQNDAASKKAC